MEVGELEKKNVEKLEEKLKSKSIFETYKLIKKELNKKETPVKESFIKMLDNWIISLPRKRIRLCTEAERIARIRKVCKGIDLKGKLDNLSSSELKDLIWKMPTTKIAKMYKVSDKAIEKKCRKFGIEKPSRGYWSKHKI